jgi:hypothetical protein
MSAAHSNGFGGSGRKERGSVRGAGGVELVGYVASDKERAN